MRVLRLRTLSTLSFPYIPQDNYLFEGSIYENIACGYTGKGQVSDAQVRRAAESAYAEEFIAALLSFRSASVFCALDLKISRLFAVQFEEIKDPACSFRLLRWFLSSWGF